MAINLLKERYGNIQEIVDLHFSKLINVTSPKNKTNELRHFLDTIERHLRSLEVSKQNIEQDVFICMIKSKLPKDVRLQMEFRKDSEIEWTVESLKKCLRTYVVARERMEQDPNPDVSSATAVNSNSPNYQNRRYDRYEKKVQRNSSCVMTDMRKQVHPDTTWVIQLKRLLLHWSDKCTRLQDSRR